MALIFSPLSEDILEGPFKPYPRGAFIMLQDNEGTPEIDRDMDSATIEILKEQSFLPLKATTKRGTKDFLEKIVQLIRGAGFGVAIFSEFTNATSLANIFFEVGLCNMLGKPVIIVKSDKAKPPSDFVRTEWVTYSENRNKLKNDLSKSLNDVILLADYFDKLGDISFEAEERDAELAFERYKQAFLISGEDKIKIKITNLLGSFDDEEGNFTELIASRKRLRKAIAEFEKFIS